MLTESEQRFFEYWKQNRELEAGFMRKLMRGLPSALLFGLPIILLLIAIYLFLPEWYSKFGNQLEAKIVVVVIAVIIIVLFFGFFKMHFQWEEYEQKFMELECKIKKEAANSKLK